MLLPSNVQVSRTRVMGADEPTGTRTRVWASDFETVSVILPVMDETFSLTQTVDIILADASEWVCEFIVVVCERTTPQAMTTVEDLRERLGDRLVVHVQRLPYLGGAIREAFQIAKGSHVLLMASDLETDPRLVKEMVAAARCAPNAVVTMTRWAPGGGFDGYSPVKLVLNWIFQRVFVQMYQVNLSDMTYAYRMMPAALVKAIDWRELRHPFLLETLLKPLRLGVSVIELPARWQVRQEGVSHNPFSQNFMYFRIGLRCRFASPQRMLSTHPAPPLPAQPPVGWRLGVSS
ncbi:MAG: glycosyltransferase [Solirubrobacteraceae bacterium]